METMAINFRAFAFIITLAAVINGLGMVRWLTVFAEYLRRKPSLDIKHYWVYTLLAGYQFLLHILLWWTLWNTRDADIFNFLTYLYLLTGPILLYLGTSLLAPDVDDGVDVKVHLSEVRVAYANVLVLVWIWAIVSGLVIRDTLAPTALFVTLFLAVSLVLRATSNPRVHAIVAIVNWVLLILFVSLYAMPLGGVAAQTT